MTPREHVLGRLGALKRLPSFPGVVRAIDQELRSPDPSPRKVARLVEEDPALSARFLSVAGSALYAGMQPPRTVTHAVTRLGLVQARRIVMTTAILDRFQKFGGADPRQFWVHSLAVAATAQVVAEIAVPAVDSATANVAFTCGLLHDIGVLALFVAIPEEYEGVNARVAEGEGVTHEVERELLGLDHGEAGEVVARAWDLPEAACEAIALHHEPSAASDAFRRLVQFVHLADFICNNQGYGRVEAGFPTRFCPAAWEASGFEIDDIDRVIERARQSARDAEHYLPPRR